MREPGSSGFPFCDITAGHESLACNMSRMGIISPILPPNSFRLVTVSSRLLFCCTVFGVFRTTFLRIFRHHVLELRPEAFDLAEFVSDLQGLMSAGFSCPNQSGLQR